jgi:hypothetical protein
MTRTHIQQYRWITTLAVLPALLTLAGAAQAATAAKSAPAAKAAAEAKAAPEEKAAPEAKAAPDEAAPPAEPPATPAPEAEPGAAAMPAAEGAPAVATQSPAAVVEAMGPETFPGRMRGLYGGSLWLEPSFHGLQWPQNTRSGFGVSGNIWLDSGKNAVTRDRPSLPNSNMWFQQGRGLLRVTPAYVSGNFFIQGQIELVGNLCQASTGGVAANQVTNTVCQSAGTFTTDDLWIRVGQWNIWDVKVGRFEAWEVYHLGMGMEPNTLERLGAGMFGVDTATSPRLEVPSLYAMNYLHDRPTEGLGVGYAAGHFYATDFLRFELLGKLGGDNYRNDNATGDTPSTYIGGRLTPILDFGWLKFKLGGEYQKRTAAYQTVDGGGNKHDNTDERTQMGGGASVQVIVDPIVEFGLNAAVGKTAHTNSYGTEVGEDSYTTKSVGGFANVRLLEGLLAGVGANWTTQLDKVKTDTNPNGDSTSHLQGFLALQYLLARQLYIKAVVGYAKSTIKPNDTTVAEWNNLMLGGRVRLMYLY